MTTTVVDIRGKSPDEWQATPGNIYVGRGYKFKGGRYEGQIWRPTLFFTPVRLREAPSRADRIEHVLKYLDWLEGPGQTPKRQRESLSLLRGKRLGCWDGFWDGEQKPCNVLCHAVVLAILADHWQPGTDRRELVLEWMAMDAVREIAQ